MTAARDDEVTRGHDRGGPLPVYQLHYAVFYNASAAAPDADSGSADPRRTSTIDPDATGEHQKASNACARHYAETFLGRLFSLQAWLNERCRESRRPSPRVAIHTIVVVRVYGPLVCLCINRLAVT